MSRETITLYAGILSPPSIESREATVRPKTYLVPIDEHFPWICPDCVVCLTVINREKFDRSKLCGYSEGGVADGLVEVLGATVRGLKTRLAEAESDLTEASRMRERMSGAGGKAG